MKGTACHLELRGLDADEACGNCGHPARAHRSHRSYRDPEELKRETERETETGVRLVHFLEAEQADPELIGWAMRRTKELTR